jgi:hypothetical protein
VDRGWWVEKGVRSEITRENDEEVNEVIRTRGEREEAFIIRGRRGRECLILNFN